jgi:hypothetical protein
MTMTLPASPPAKSAAIDSILRIVIVLFGAIEGITSISDLSLLFGDISKLPSPTSIALHPLLGFAAVAFALMGKLRSGIAALAVWWLTQWVGELPYLIRDGITMTASTFVNAHEILKSIIQPIIGAGAFAAAWFNRHLMAATIAVTLPTLFNAAGIAGFAISVMLYGF